MRRALIVLPVLVVTGAAVAALYTGGAEPDGVALAGPPATTTVQKRTLTRTERVSGALGYGEVTEVRAPPGLRGMVTWLPYDGTILHRDDTVYRVDQKRIPLLFGTIPIYRIMRSGISGSDVHQLERNLSALGYTGFTVDRAYTAATAAAVRDWQEHLGRTRTGRVEIGDAVVATGPRRVAELTGAPGSAAAGTLLTWTETTRVVTVDLPTEHADLARPGVTATVVLPDDSEVEAKIKFVGTPTGATVPMELTVADQKRLGDYQAADVSVDLAAETRTGVLAVPVNALVARSGGGYAVVTGNDHLPVTTGLFSGGYVEISGTGVAEGLVVEVPE